ncbi:MAG: ribosome biogenesis GTPase Der [Nitrospirota bacterium]
MKKVITAIIGRPNVGKSTLFNRLIKKRVAVTENQPGITRDRNYGICKYKDREFIIVDTGGFIPKITGGMTGQVRKQTDIILKDADYIIFVMDGKDSITDTDRYIAKELRKRAKPIFYAINKIDNKKAKESIYDFFLLGMEKIYPVSAEHGLGIRDLLEDIYSMLPEDEKREEDSDYPKIAVLGRPNVGKSTFINSLLGEDRLITDKQPGTTRDAIDTIVERKNKRYIFIDTAGIRRRGKIIKGVERYSVNRSLKSLSRSDVALLLIDGPDGITEQDKKIAGTIIENGKGCIIVINKSDLMLCDSRKDWRNIEREIRYRLPFLYYANILFISALKGYKINNIFKEIEDVNNEYSREVSTGELNRFFKDAIENHSPPIYRNKVVKIYYATQVSKKPPTFILFVNYPDGISASYLKYIENRFRKKFGSIGTPIRFLLRKRQ